MPHRDPVGWDAVHAERRWLPGGCLLGLAAAVVLTGCAGVKRNMIVESEPPGAKLYVDAAEKGQTPAKFQLKWKSEVQPEHGHTIVLHAEDYEDQTYQLTYQEAKEASDPWMISSIMLPLRVRIRARFESVPAGATVMVEGHAPLVTPAAAELDFRRASSTSPWGAVKAVFSMPPDYAPDTTVVTYEGLRQSPVVMAGLKRIRHEVPVDIRSNVAEATVAVNGKVVGVTPLRHTFVFTRADTTEPWDTFLVVVSKEGYYHKPSKKLPGEAPPFSWTLTYEDAAKGTLDAPLHPILFVRTKLTRYVSGAEGLEKEEEIVLSQVGEAEREPKVQAVTRVTDAKPEDAFSGSRISVMPGGQQIVHAFPYRLPDRFEQDYFNLWIRRGNEQTRLTDGEFMDVEPCVSSDGQWVYFASTRLGFPKVTVWRIAAIGRGGLTKVTDSPSSAVDTEPSVSPDGKKIAYTCHLRTAKLAQVWVANADGTLPTQLRQGTSPAWSPDGTKIAFVAPDNNGRDKIWVMDSDGSNPTQLTSGDQNDQYPAWVPDGKRIVYASDRALNAEGIRNFDIWIMNVDGTRQTQLTVNGSYDTRPAVSPEGRYVYFISNRGARKEYEEAWQIWRFELPAE